MKKLVLLICFFVLTIALYGCGQTSGKVDKPPIASVKHSKSIDVDIYLDGTYSMSGYVNFSGSTVYIDSLKNTERAITSGWKSDNINYFKFGDGIKKISRNRYLEANKVSFYQETDTSLQKVIDQIDDKKMSVIVTDLFQTNQDIDSLVKSLKAKCFSDESMGMALIGIKSQFNGTIYDVGKNLKSFTYKTTSERSSYRPFYMMVLGKEADVRYFASILSKDYDGEIYKVVLFSKNIGSKQSLMAGKRDSENNKEKIAHMAKISTLLGSESNVLQYRLKLAEKKSSVNCLLEVDQVVGQAPKSFESFSFVLEKWSSDGKKEKQTGAFDKMLSAIGIKGKESAQKSFKVIKADKFMEVSSDKVNEDNGIVKVPLKIFFNPTSIKKSEGKYRIRFSLYPAKDEYIHSNKVFSEWNFTDSQVSSLQDLQSCGNKTLNVESFVDVISALNFELNKPGVHKNYIYLDAIK